MEIRRTEPMNAPRKIDRSQHPRGMSLVETMIALAVSGVVITGTMLFMSNSEKSRAVLEAMATRDSIATKISQTAGLPAAIATTMGTDAALMACVMGNNTPTGCPSTITNPATQRAFALSIPLGTAGTSRVASFPPGPPAPAIPPVFYDIKGRPSTQTESFCNVGGTPTLGKKCPYIALATYWATCPDMAPSCPFASFINVRYQLKIWQAPGGTPQDEKPFAGFSLANVPPDPDFTNDKTAFSIPVSADQIRKYGGSACTSFHPLAIINRGAGVITTSSAPVCVCPTGFIRTPADLTKDLTNCTPDPLENKVCRDTATGEKCIMVGIRRNNVPVCRTIAERLACRTINLSANEACTVNGAAGWIESVTMGVCKAIQPPPASKKAAAGEVTIDCDQSDGKCCNFTTSISNSDVNSTACGI